MKQIWSIIFYLFLYSGSLKLAFQFMGVGMPVDLTLMFALLLVGKMLYVLSCGGSKTLMQEDSSRGVVLLFAFFITVFLSLLYTASPEFGVKKFVLSLLNIIAFLFPVVYREIDLQKVSKFVVGYSFAIFFMVFYSIQVRWLGGAEVFGSKDTDLLDSVKNAYLTSGMLLGISVLLLEFSQYRLKVLFQVLCIVLIFLLGSRGPLLFTLLLFLFLKMRHARGMSVKPGVLAAFVLVFVVFAFSDYSFLSFDNVERSLERFKLLFSSEGNSINERVRMIDFAVAGIFGNDATASSFFFGRGIGSFGILFSSVDGRLYPHNILLELFFETGLLGVTLFCMLLVHTLRKLRHGVYLYISLFILLNCLKSYTLEDIRFLFGFLALAMVQSSVYRARVSPGSDRPTEALSLFHPYSRQ